MDNSIKVILAIGVILSGLIVFTGVQHIDDIVKYKEWCESKGGVTVHTQMRIHCIRKDSFIIKEGS